LGIVAIIIFVFYDVIKSIHALIMRALAQKKFKAFREAHPDSHGHLNDHAKHLLLIYVKG